MGTARSNMGMSAEVVTRSLIKYLKDTREKHADKILCEVTCQHIFKNVPIPDSALWKGTECRGHPLSVEGNLKSPPSDSPCPGRAGLLLSTLFIWESHVFI